MTNLHKPVSLAEFKKTRKPLHDVNREVKENTTKLMRLALWITNRVGTIGFFLTILLWSVLWLGWNLLAPAQWQFDPPNGFVFWLFISNLIQILLMPLIMVGQNIQGAHAQARAQSDLEVNIKAEQEIETVLLHLEYQNAILVAMLEKMGVNLDEALRQR